MVSLSILVKARKREDLREGVFRKHVYALCMQFYAGKEMIPSLKKCQSC
jgi:hypothetical protein